MTKSSQDSDKKDDQQESLSIAVRAILKEHSLTFSERGVRSVLKVIKRFQSTLVRPKRLTKSQIRTKIKALKETASQLSEQLGELSSHIALEDPPDALQLKLNHLVLCCEQFLAHCNAKIPDKEGRPFETIPLRYLVHKLILIYEEETGEGYVIKEVSRWGRERTAYSSLAKVFVTSILEFVAPDHDPKEAIKVARLPPISLDQARKIFSTNQE